MPDEPQETPEQRTLRFDGNLRKLSPEQWLSNQIGGINCLLNGLAFDSLKLKAEDKAIRDKFYEFELTLRTLEENLEKLKFQHANDINDYREIMIGQHIQIKALTEQIVKLTERHENLGKAFSAHTKETKNDTGTN